MNFKLTLTLSILLLLAASLFFFLHSRPAAPETTDESKLVVNPAPKEVTAFSFARDGKVRVAFEKKGEQWRMTTPVDAPASVSWIADELGKMTYAQKFAPAASGAHTEEATGVAKPRYRIEYTDDAGAKHVLLVGKTSVEGVYAKVEGAKEILVLPQNPVEALDKDPLTFRDRHLKTIDTERVSKIVISRPDQDKIELTKAGGKWMISHPLTAARVNAGTVEEVLGTMRSIDASGFSDLPPDNAGTGLTPPALTVTVYEEGAGENPLAAMTRPAATTSKPAVTEITLNVGYYTELSNKQNVFATLDKSGDVFTLPTETYKKLDRSLKELRDPAVTPAAVAEATGVTITGQGQGAVTMVKEAGGWKLPNEKVRGDEEQINNLLTDIATLRAINFVDNAGDLKSIGLDPPMTRVELTVPSQPQHEVILIGKSEKDDKGGNVTPVMRQGEPAVYLVQSGDAEKIRTGALAYRARDVERLTPDNVRSISVTGPLAPQGGLTLTRNGTTWSVNQGGKTTGADAVKITNLLANFTPLIAQTWLDEKADSSGAPDVVVKLTMHEPIAASQPAATGPATSTAPATMAAVGPANAAGPMPTREVTRTLRLYRTSKTVETWKALWDVPAGGEPQWTFQPQLGLIDHLIRESYVPAPTSAPATQSATQPGDVGNKEPTTNPANNPASNPAGP